MLLSIVWSPTFFKISSFVLSRRKKFIQVWSNLNVDTIFIFWVNDPFKLCDGFVIIILYLMNLPTFIADCIVMSKSCNVFTFSLTIDDV